MPQKEASLPTYSPEEEKRIIRNTDGVPVGIRPDNRWTPTRIATWVAITALGVLGDYLRSIDASRRYEPATIIKKHQTLTAAQRSMRIPLETADRVEVRIGTIELTVRAPAPAPSPAPAPRPAPPPAVRAASGRAPLEGLGFSASRHHLRWS